MDKGEMSQYPEAAGVYAVYDSAGEVQYIGLSRKVNASVAHHMQSLPDLTHAVRFHLVEGGGKDDLTAAWKAWMEEAIVQTGTVPPGNAPGETKWQGKAARAKSEIKLTAGKAISVPISELVDQVVKTNKVVAFVKGTRSQPQCGFSYKMLSLLNDVKADYEVVNVLDEFHNPGLRDAIKEYSAWPTIPQLYIQGEFVGGADIVEQMAGNGELQMMVRAASGTK
ncbi:MAG: glutaredoxin [Monoraphidium minutum]|nr:MAG: glutaredoxin [Monoraphidium minutum]